MALNIYNSSCLEFWHEAGAKGAVLSAELTLKQIEHLCAVSPMPLECLVQGRIEMMVSEYCAGGSFLGGLDKGKCSFNCREQLFLNDRKDARETAQMAALYKGVMNGEIRQEENLPHTTRGHYFRGVL